MEYNSFIDYRNHQFTPTKPDAEIQAMIDAPKNKMNTARDSLHSIQNENDNTKSLMIGLYKSIDDAMQKINEQEDFVKEYLSKGKGGRRGMFYKKTWFGIPLN